jgi:hypothetical protein
MGPPPSPMSIFLVSLAVCVLSIELQPDANLNGSGPEVNGMLTLFEEFKHAR